MVAKTHILLLKVSTIGQWWSSGTPLLCLTFYANLLILPASWLTFGSFNCKAIRYVLAKSLNNSFNQPPHYYCCIKLHILSLLIVLTHFGIDCAADVFCACQHHLCLLKNLCLDCKCGYFTEGASKHSVALEQRLSKPRGHIWVLPVVTLYDLGYGHDSECLFCTRCVEPFGCLKVMPFKTTGPYLSTSCCYSVWPGLWPW